MTRSIRRAGSERE